jgi:hypothetical protein
MASMVGTSSETVIRHMTEFKEERFLEQEGKVIFLLDVRGITEAANLSI